MKERNDEKEMGREERKSVERVAIMASDRRNFSFLFVLHVFLRCYNLEI